jgi:hypothetical protein
MDHNKAKASERWPHEKAHWETELKQARRAIADFKLQESIRVPDWLILGTCCGRMLQSILPKAFLRSKPDQCIACRPVLSARLPATFMEQAVLGCLGCCLYICAYYKFIENENIDDRCRCTEEGDQESEATFKFSNSRCGTKTKITIEFKSLKRTYMAFAVSPKQAVNSGRSLKHLKRLQNKNSGSSESFKQIAQWMEQCNGHKDCHVEQTRLPTRVLDVDCPQGIRLQSGLGLTDRYCALSHCWGSKGSPLKTTRANFASHESTIDEDELPKTFCDAIKLVRYIGIRYLWIDSLCIIQDSKEDWQRQSAQMASIYRNAHLVVAATQASDGEVGCFVDYPDCSSCVALPAEPDGDIDIYLMAEPKHFYDKDSTQSARAMRMNPLLSRAWCLQERLLSRRLIHFAREELVWECQEQRLCDCGYHAGSVRSFQGTWLACAEPNRLFDRWHGILDMYSSMHISYESDRLPALSGLAKRFQEFGCGDYVAGIWRQSVLDDIGWVGSGMVSRPVTWRAPSWSPLCGDTQIIDRPRLTLAEPVQAPLDSEVSRLNVPLTEASTKTWTRLVNLEYETSGIDATGDLKWAKITLSVAAIDSQLSISTSGDHRIFLGPGTPTGLRCTLDCLEDFSDTVTQVLCIWIGDFRYNQEGTPSIMILQPSRGLCGRSPELDCFERVGMIRSTYLYPEFLKGQFLNAHARCVTIV